jgi:hypothetical protein
MSKDSSRIRILSGGAWLIVGVWLIGTGVLFATKFWWPGIMFLIAASAVLEGWLHYRPLWYAIQVGYWSAFVGVCALVGFNLVFLLVALGVGAIIGALVSPGQSSKPKPFVDSSME